MCDEQKLYSDDYITIGQLNKLKKGNMKNKFIKKKIKGITVDVRSKDSLYITIGDWVIYLDNSTNEKIVNTWSKKDNQ